MDSRISNPMTGGSMTVVQENDNTASATVTIQTEASPDIATDDGGSNSSTHEQNSSGTDWLQTLTANPTIHITADTHQLSDTVGGGGVVGGTSDDTVVMGVQAGDWISRIKGARYHNNGKYIIGYADDSTELQQVLQDYTKLTGTSFPSMQQLNLVTKTTEDSYLQQRFLTRSARPRLFWQMHAGEPIIHFDGVPFITVGQCTDIHCLLAGKRKAANQLLVATGDVLATKMHTQGCSAKISIRRILRYPSSRLPEVGVVQGITAMRKLRRQVLEVLTAKICAGLAKPTQRYYFSLPTPLAHDTHIVAEMEDPPSLIEPVHDQILTLISSAVTNVTSIHDHIRKYVGKTYGDNPSKDDPTFNPSRYDLCRYIYWLYKSGRVVDQDCPFKERYTLSTEEIAMINKTASPPLTTPTDTPPQSATDDNGLVNIYNMAVDETADLATLELPGAQVGAEEVTGTSSIAVTTNATTPITPHTHKKTVASLPQNSTPNVFGINDYSSFDSSTIEQTQSEVHSILTILQNQTLACNDVSALQTLRRQLTTLCTEFSIHLATGQAKRPLGYKR